MATNYITQIQDTSNTTHDLIDTFASHYIKGTQTAATNAWTGALPDGVTAYYDGLSIDYFLPYAGTSTAATLNLSSKGAKPVYVGDGTSAVTTHFPQYSVIHLTYLINSNLNSGNGCWKATGYYNTNTDTKVTQNITTTNASYAVLLSYSTTDSSTRTESSRKTTTLTYNPSTKALATGGTVDGYTLAGASAKAVDTSIALSSSSANLPTSAAVASHVANNYLALTGGTVTGPTTFGDSVTIDEATIGDLVVTGNVSFANMLDICYPVGSYYETSDTTFNPNNVWGGTWEEVDGTFVNGTGTFVNITSYTSSNSPYVFPSNGVIKLACGYEAGNAMSATILDADDTGSIALVQSSASSYTMKSTQHVQAVVYKGQRCYCTKTGSSSSSTVYFFPYTYSSKRWHRTA